MIPENFITSKGTQINGVYKQGSKKTSLVTPGIVQDVKKDEVEITKIKKPKKPKK